MSAFLDLLSVALVAAAVILLLGGCATAEPLEIPAEAGESCSACFEACGGMPNDRAARWCVWDCVEVCDVDR